MLMEKYNNLISAYAGDEDALEIIKSDMKRMNDYVNVVYNETYLTPLYRVMYNDQELRDRIQALDSDRRTKHDLAIMAVKRMNRFCVMCGVELLYEGTDDRYEIAEFCNEVTNEFFRARSL